MTCDERGAASVEWALLVPALLVVMCATVAGARLGFARQHLHDAVASAARAATVQHDATRADAAARRYLRANVDGCQLVHVDLNTAALRTSAGTPGKVTVAARCRVAMSDLIVPGLPGAIEVTAQASSVVDTYARRNP